MRASAATTLASWLSLTSCAGAYESVQLRSGATSVDETATDGANGHAGYDLGLSLAGMYKLDPCWSVGGAAAIDVSSHAAAAAPATAQYAGTGPRAIVRRELTSRLAVAAYGGYDVLGFRAITEPSGPFAGTVSSVKLRGETFGATVLVRIPFSGGALELGPFVDAGYLHSTEDEGRTTFVETNMPVHVLTLGFAVQAAFGALP